MPADQASFLSEVHLANLQAFFIQSICIHIFICWVSVHMNNTNGINAEPAPPAHLSFSFSSRLAIDSRPVPASTTCSTRNSIIVFRDALSAVGASLKVWARASRVVAARAFARVWKVLALILSRSAASCTGHKTAWLHSCVTCVKQHHGRLRWQTWETPTVF